MSILNQIAGVLQTAVTGNVKLSAAFDMNAIYAGRLPEGVTSAITIDGFSTGTTKASTRDGLLQLWLPVSDPSKAGDILDLADEIITSLRGSAILAEQWVHQPDTANSMDRVVIPISAYLARL